MNKNVISLIVFLLTGTTLLGQTKMNVLKTDLFAPLIPAAVLKYERVINEDISIQMGGFYVFDIPSFGGDWAEGKGYGITPELRYYPYNKRTAPQGIYLATNFRYQKFLTKNHDENAEATVISNSPAIHLGYQLVVKDILVLEAWVGLAYYFRQVVDETVPGASIGFKTSNEFGGRGGIGIGVLF